MDTVYLLKPRGGAGTLCFVMIILHLRIIKNRVAELTPLFSLIGNQATLGDYFTSCIHPLKKIPLSHKSNAQSLQNILIWLSKMQKIKSSPKSQQHFKWISLVISFSLSLHIFDSFKTWDCFLLDSKLKKISPKGLFSNLLHILLLSQILLSKNDSGCCSDY